MKFLQNIKHIFIISAICLGLLFGSYKLLTRDFFVPINYFLIYRTGIHAGFQDVIYKHKSEPSDAITIVEIDDATMSYYTSEMEYSMLAIPKSDYAKFMERMKEYGAKSVGFDIIFQNRDAGEEDFIKSMIEFGNAVIAFTKAQKNSIGPNDIKDGILYITNTPLSIYKNIKWWYIHLGETAKNQVLETRAAAHDIKQSAAQTTAKFGENAELGIRDGIMWALPVAMVENENLPAIKSIKNIVQRWYEKYGSWGQPFMQPYFIDNRTSTGSNKEGAPYSTVSFREFLDRPWEYERLIRDKYVLVGETGTMIHDKVLSPAENVLIPGVYTHAFFLDSILQNKILTKMTESTGFILSIVITIFAIIFYFFAPKFVSPIFAILSIFATIFVLRYFYDQQKIVIDIFPILLGVSLLSYPITYIYKFFIIEKDKRLIMNAFSRYLSPHVVEMIDTKKINVTLGGEKKELSILFSDIAGFTTISEKMDTKDLFVLMTKYLSKMTDVLTAQGGTLDKYIGDAVMGFFGAPVDDPLHAVNACHTALKMRGALADFNKMLISEWKETIDFRVGIATGEVMVGNIGSEKQFNYTVLGDTVNLASRLEATGKEYGVNIIIAASTRLAIGDEFLLRELDYIAVKGKNEWVRIYELVGKRGDEIDMTRFTNYETALRLYRDGKYFEAGKIWESLAEIDKPSKIMMYRCVDLIQGKMQLQNGVYVMTHK